MDAEEERRRQHEKILQRISGFCLTEGGQESMSRIMEELCNEAAAKAAAEAAAKAEHKKCVENAKAMLQDGLDYHLIVKYSGLTMEEVEELSELQPV